MMNIKVGNRTINAAQIVETKTHEVSEGLRVDIVTTAVGYRTVRNEKDGTFSVVPSAHTIHLFGEEAELFLEAYPAYEPVRESEPQGGGR